IGSANGVVSVLEKDGAVGLAVERRVVSGVDQRVGLFLLLRLAPNERFDIGVLGIENNHLRRPPRLATGFDDTGKRVEALHEARRTGSPAAARQNAVFFTKF